MKKKNWVLLYICFGVSVIIYLLIFLLGTGVLGAIIKSGYVAACIHLDENTSATIYRLVIDIVILYLLWNIWKKK